MNHIARFLFLVFGLCLSSNGHYTLVGKQAPLRWPSVSFIRQKSSTVFVGPGGSPFLDAGNFSDFRVYKTAAPITSDEIPEGAIELTLEEAAAETQAVIDSLVDSTLAIAAAYGVTNVPVDWFAVDAAIEAASNSEDELVSLRAIKDGIRLSKNTMFLKEWGVDLFSVGAE